MSEKKRQLSEEEFRDKLKNGEYDKFKKVEVDDEFGEYITNLIKISIKDELSKAIDSKYGEDSFLIAEEMERKNYEMSSAQKIIPSELLTDYEYDFKDWVLVSNVKQILEQRGLKQSWLQEKTKIPLSTLRSILNNEKAVSLENAFKISIVMELPITQLFSYVSIGDIAIEDNN